MRSSSYEALGKFGEHSRSQSCSWLRVEQLLRIFRALQTSRVLHMNAQLTHEPIVNPPYGKRWRLYILPQYLANLTEPFSNIHRKPHFGEIHPCTNKIVYARFEVFEPCGSLLCFWARHFYSHSGKPDKMLGGYLRWTRIPSRRRSNIPIRRLMLRKPG